MANLAQLVNIRGGHRAAITKAVKEIDRLLQGKEYDTLNALSQTIKNHMSKVDQLNDQITTMIEGKDLEKDIFEQVEYETDINTHLLTIQSALKSNPVKTDTNTAKTLYKLPKLTLPTYEGDPTLWTSFWDVFECIIDDYKDLSDVQKFTYLKGQLKGEAAELIKGFKVENASYATAVDLLKKTYGQPDKVKTAFVQKLLDLTPPDYEVNSLKNFYASFESAVRSIHNLNITEDEIMTVILTSKVPSPLKEIIKRELKKDTLNLDSFIERYQLEVYNMDQRDSVSHSIGATAAFATPVSPIKDNVTKPGCKLCAGGHPWFKCTKYPQNVQKIKKAQELKLCTKCMQNHEGGKCNNPKIRDCKHCKGRHYHVLCPNEDKSKSKDSSPQKTVVQTTTCSVSAKDKSTTILPTMKLPVVGKEGGRHVMRVLLDSCSQRTFICRDSLSHIKFTSCKSEELKLHGFTSTAEPKMYDVVKIFYKYHGKTKFISAVVVDSLPEHSVKGVLIPQLLDLERKGCKLADSELQGDGRVHLLVGGDHYYDLVHPGYKREGDLILLPTIRGYAITGTCVSQFTNTEVDVVTILKVAVSPTEKYYNPTAVIPKIEDLNALWDLDNIGIVSNDLDSKSKMVLKQFEDSISYDENEGSYKVGLPWNSKKELLQTNYGTALGRLRSLQRRFSQDTQYQKQYTNIIKEQELKGFIEKVPPSDIHKGSHIHYLSHHGVKKESETTPIRVVFDCSAMGSNGVSLNDCLETGPSLVPDLAGVLLNFRLYGYACTADIEKAYLMVQLRENDRDSVRFLFPENPADPDSPCHCYRFKVVLFGATCSQFLLNAVILYHLDKLELEPALITQIKSGLYIDNLQNTSNSEGKLVQFFKIIRETFKAANLNLREWVSNSPQLQQLTTSEGLSAKRQDQMKILGMEWRVQEDNLTFCTNLHDPQLTTKRQCLSVLARVFDPLGLILPVTIRARMGLQDLWRSGVNWDETLDVNTQLWWDELISDMSDCTKMTVPRAVTLTNDVQLHVFSDASTQAYGTVAYLVTPNTSRLVMAKAKVAPLKKVTVPKLELTAVLLSARLLKFVISSYADKLNITGKFMWCDSQIALHWLKNDKNKPLYVIHRVDEIKELTPTTTIRYVPTTDNPADLVTRGLTAAQLNKSTLWWEGPQWLTTGQWPEDIQSGEIKESIMTTLVAEKVLTPMLEWEKYSSYTRVIRVVAWVQRFVRNLKAATCNEPKQLTSDLTLSEQRRAEVQLIKWIQRETFPNEWEVLKGSKIKAENRVNQLGLFVENDLIKCRGRLQQANLRHNGKFPILLPNSHHITKLLVQRYHKLSSHYGVNYVLAYMRQNWWIPRMRQVIKKVHNKCKTCKRMQSKPYFTNTNPSLPHIRVNRTDPFSCTGVDYAGPMNIKSPKDIKGYIVLFTCATTRAVHLEVVNNLTSETFIHVLRRFVARKGYPQIMMSDNATNFVGAANYLKELQSDPKIKDVLKDKGIEWRFVPAKAPWFGAIWERLIGVLKMGIRKVLGRALITMEELMTVVSELEATINDRPLTYVSSDQDELDPITPSMLLYGRRLLPYPSRVDEDSEDPTYMEGPSEMRIRLAYISKLSNTLWLRWSKEYLTFLKQKGGFNNNSSCPNIGDVVIVHDEGPRLYWKLAKIIETIKGSDGIVRVARIKMGDNITTRPVSKLYPLEQSLESTDTTYVRPNPSEEASDQSRRPQRMAALKSTAGWKQGIKEGLL